MQKWFKIFNDNRVGIRAALVLAIGGIIAALIGIIPKFISSDVNIKPNTTIDSISLVQFTINQIDSHFERVHQEDSTIQYPSFGPNDEWYEESQIKHSKQDPVFDITVMNNGKKKGNFI